MSAGGDPGLSLVLACFNEAPWLAQSVREIRAVLDGAGLDAELVFVDDASTDGTAGLIRSLLATGAAGRARAVFHAANTGRGSALADGFRAAAGEAMGFIDVDLEVHPRHIPACVAALRAGADVVVGCRRFAFSFRGLWRRFLSAGYRTLAHLLLPLDGIRDTESNCKFFRRAAALPVLERVEDAGWFWDTESMVRCRLAGLAIAEVPCEFVRDPSKPSTVRVWRDIAESLVKLLAFRRRLKRAGLLARRKAAA